jgi:hypothetical protein
MTNYPDKIYQQAIVILDSGTIEKSVALSKCSPMALDLTSPIAASEKVTLILRENLSSVPAIWDSELSQSYRELGDTLHELTELTEDDVASIEVSVFSAACYVASQLMLNSIPPPRVFNHGSKSVVFNWTLGADNVYLTISADKMSALISSPERIQRRIEYSADQLMESSFSLFIFGIASRGNPIKHLTTKTTSEVELLG